MNRMKATSLALALLALAGALWLTACASRLSPSEREWQRGQCGQVIDSDAREKCLKRVDSE